jgi:hypothetical protein
MQRQVRGPELLAENAEVRLLCHKQAGLRPRADPATIASATGGIGNWAPGVGGGMPTIGSCALERQRVGRTSLTS